LKNRNIPKAHIFTAVVLLTTMAFAALAGAPAHGQDGQDRLDGNLRFLLAQYETTRKGQPADALKGGKRVHVVAGSRQAVHWATNVQKNLADLPDVRLPVLVKFSGKGDELRSRGFQTKSGDIYTGLVDLSLLDELTRVPGIHFIKLNEIYYSSLNQQEDPLYVSSVKGRWSDANISGKATESGEGVIVAVIDTGVDIGHHDFRKADGTTRIKYLLDLSEPGDLDGDGDLDGPDDFGGTLYTESDINDALARIYPRPVDSTGHGTHVLSIAAGDDREFPGIAPGADIIAVKATRDDGTLDFWSVDIISALSFIDQRASSLSLPYVVNLSLGTILASHDGLSLEELAIDSLVGPGKSGKVVVLAAGNSSETGSSRYHHFQGQAYAGLSVEHTLTVPEYSSENPGVGDDFFALELWYEGNDDLTVSIIAPDQLTQVEAPHGTFVLKATPFGDVFVGNMGGRNPLNGKKQVNILVYDRAATPPAAGDWILRISGERIEDSGQYHGWLADDSRIGEIEPFLSANADNEYLIGSPGGARHGITVGSFVSHDPQSRFRTSWTDVSGLPHGNRSLVPGSLSTFSSTGGTLDHRVKPELVAPGEFVVGAISREAYPTRSETSIYRFPGMELEASVLREAPDLSFGLLRGTSFAAPVITGLAARILSIDPSLDAIQVRNMLINSAIADGFTGRVPSPSWGYGKADLGLAVDSGVALPETLYALDTVLPAGTLGKTYSHALAASGGDVPYTWTLFEGDLPPGLVLQSNVITGTPTESGGFLFTLRLTDAAIPARELFVEFEIAIVPSDLLRIVTTYLPVGGLDRPFVKDLAAEGGVPPYSWSLVARDLPDGLALDVNGHLSGAPSVLGEFPFTVGVDDSTGETTLRSFVLVVSSERGDVWNPLGTGAPGVTDFAVDPNDLNHVFVATWGPEGGEIFETKNRGDSWESISVNNNAGGSILIKSLEVEPLTSTLWGVNYSYPSVRRYDPLKKEWVVWPYCLGWGGSLVDDLGFDGQGDIFLLPYRLICEVDSGQSQYLGFLQSSSGGQSWDNVGSFPPIFSSAEARSVLNGSLAIAPSNPDIMYVARGEARGTGASEERIYPFFSSSDRGMTWTHLGDRSPGYQQLLVSSVDPLDVLAMPHDWLTGRSDHFDRSRDGGITWTSYFVPGANEVCLLSRPDSRPEIIWLGSNQGFFKSVDDGSSWERIVIDGLKGQVCRWHLGTSSGLNYRLNSMTVVSSDPDQVWVGVFGDGLFFSEDGGQEWTRRNNGLSYRRVEAVAIDPTAPEHMLITSTRGIYITRNGGQRWVLANEGIGLNGPGANGFRTFPVLASESPGRYYVTSGSAGLYRSDNGGLSWYEPHPGFGTSNSDYGFVWTLEGDPFDSEVLVVQLTKVDTSTGTSVSSTFWRSLDGGASWAQIAAGLDADPRIFSGRSLVFARDVEGKLLAVAKDGLYSSPDKGETWNLVKELPEELPKGSSNGMVVAPSDSRHVYVSRYGGLYSLDPFTNEWLVDSSLRLASGLAVDANDPRIAYAGLQHPGTSGGIGGIYKTVDGGHTWQRLPGLLDGLSVVWIAIHPASSDIVYVATPELGVFKSENGGDSWQYLNEYATIADFANVVVQDPVNPFILYVGTEGFGVQISIDDGLTFLSSVEGLDNYYVNVLTFDPEDPAVLYAGTDGGLFRSANSGATWEATDGTDGVITDIKVNRGDRPRRRRMTTFGGGVGFSEGEGYPFYFRNNGLPSLKATSLAVESTAHGERIWVTLQDGGGVAYSDDEGQSWISAVGSGLTSRNVNHLAVEPDSGGKKWIATDDGIFFTDNDGVTWSQFSSGLPSEVPVTSIAIDPNSGEMMISLFSEEKGGVYRGANLTGAWSAFNAGLHELRVRKLTHDGGHVTEGALSETTFFAATSGDGIYSSNVSTTDAESPVVLATNVPMATVLQEFSMAFSAAGGSPPYGWLAVEGDLPPGLELDEFTGVVSGVPVGAGSYWFVAQAVDSNGRSGTRMFSILVASSSVQMTVFKTGSGGGDVTSTDGGVDCGEYCRKTYPTGSTVALRAMAHSGSVFAGWRSGCSGVGACSLELYHDQDVVAEFVLANEPGVLVSEVDLGGAGYVELYNSGSGTVDLEGWSLWVGDGQGHELPSFALAPGSFVQAMASSRDGGEATIPLGEGFHLPAMSAGSIALLDRSGWGEDYVRWGLGEVLVPSGTSWSESEPLTFPASTLVLGRKMVSVDSDSATDWCVQVPSPLTARSECSLIGIFSDGFESGDTSVWSRSIKSWSAMP